MGVIRLLCQEFLFLCPRITISFSLGNNENYLLQQTPFIEETESINRCSCRLHAYWIPFELYGGWIEIELKSMYLTTVISYCWLFQRFYCWENGSLQKYTNSGKWSWTVWKGGIFKAFLIYPNISQLTFINLKKRKFVVFSRYFFSLSNVFQVPITSILICRSSSFFSSFHP